MTLRGPLLTREQVRRVDAIAIDEIGIPGVVLMENAGRNATDVIEEVHGRVDGQRFIVLAGPGNNGGDGFVIARHLRHRGHQVAVHLVGREDRLRGDAAVNHAILPRMAVPVPVVDALEEVQVLLNTLGETDVVVDALLGTGFQGEVREPLATLIRGLNERTLAGRIAIDIPSGLDCDTGVPTKATFRADLTVTFVAPKVGFAEAGAAAWTGEVRVADIGAPPGLVDRVRRE